MAGSESKLPVKTEKKEVARPSDVQLWRPFASLRNEVDRLFEDFGRGKWGLPMGRRIFDMEPFAQFEKSWGVAPAADMVEKDNAYEVTVELPGIEEKDIDVRVSDGSLTIRGEKQEEKEEKKKDYYLRERSFGSFERSFSLPDGVDADKIDASVKKGVLTLTLPKKPEAQKPVKKIEVKSA